jgi:hypothetical protein
MKKEEQKNNFEGKEEKASQNFNHWLRTYSFLV